MTDQPEHDDHACKPDARLYFCPTAGEVESDCHGGFDVCCGRADLHLPIADADPTIAALQAAARRKGVRLALAIEDSPAPEPSDPTQCSGEEGFCPEHGYHRHSLKQADRGVASSIDAAYAIRPPAEHCGHILPGFFTDRWTECVLRPGHQGSHANHEGARWVEKPAAGYCPHCGRGDAGPTADQYEQLRKRARQDAVASRESERQLQQQIDAQAKELDRLQAMERHARGARPLRNIQGRCPACHGESLFLADGNYVTCARLECPDPEAATRILERRPDSCGFCGQRPVTYYAPDGHPACADCAPCDCGTEPCSKPDVVARRDAAHEPLKETPDA